MKNLARVHPKMAFKDKKIYKVILFTEDSMITVDHYNPVYTDAIRGQPRLYSGTGTVQKLVYVKTPLNIREFLIKCDEACWKILTDCTTTKAGAEFLNKMFKKRINPTWEPIVAFIKNSILLFSLGWISLSFDKYKKAYVNPGKYCVGLPEECTFVFGEECFGYLNMVPDVKTYYTDIAAFGEQLAFLPTSGGTDAEIGASGPSENRTE
jgi:hypothetical protein